MGKQLLKSILAGSLLIANSLAGEMPDYVKEVIDSSKTLSEKYEKIGEPKITEEFGVYLSNSFVYDIGEIKVDGDEFKNLRPKKQKRSLDSTFNEYDSRYVTTPNVRGKHMLDSMRHKLEPKAFKAGYVALVYDPIRISFSKNDTLYINAEVDDYKAREPEDFKKHIESFFKN